METIFCEWQFDMQRFEDVVVAKLELCEMSAKEFDDMIGKKNFVQAMVRGDYSRNDKVPTLRNFILVCGLLDIDPRYFWVVE